MEGPWACNAKERKVGESQAGFPVINRDFYQTGEPYTEEYTGFIKLSLQSIILSSVICRALRERERNLTQKTTSKQALEEEIKQAAGTKNEVMAELRKLEGEVIDTTYIDALFLFFKHCMGEI